MLRSAVASIVASTRQVLAESMPILSCSIQHATAPQGRCSSTFAETLQSEFQRDPEKAAAAVGALSDTNKAEILKALAGGQGAPVGSIKYLNSLFKSADLNQDGRLCKDELAGALQLHKLQSKDTRSGAPTREEVMRVFTASAIPFVGFGFLDNLIMILAGDYIDAKLGAAFAISTMAAAGLGNLISDIAGIFMADSIESRARVWKFGRMPQLSAIQRQSNTVFFVKSLGAVIGISIGCIAGMFPLLLWPKKQKECDAADSEQKNSSAATAAA